MLVVKYLRRCFRAMLFGGIIAFYYRYLRDTLAAPQELRETDICSGSQRNTGRNSPSMHPIENDHLCQGAEHGSMWAKKLTQEALICQKVVL